MNELLRERNARVAEIEALLRDADAVVTWETAMPNGQAFQERIEKALSSQIVSSTC